MNNIYDKGIDPCSSCGVCAVACPVNCITIERNEEGFFRPTVDESRCTGCGQCKKVCYQYLETQKPFVNFFHDKPIYGAWSKGEKTRLSCSSGGVGHELISNALKEGYNACGVIFDAPKDECKHILASAIEEVECFKGSKYLQSYTVDAFRQFKKDQKYIVVGTPCQIYGLRQWLKIKKWEDNFVLVDFFCHGTPSYLLWEKYKQHIQQKYGLGEFKEVLFRSKEKSSWHSYAMKISDFSDKQYIQTKAFSDDLFFKFFLSDSCLNESCYQCRLRLDHCGSDIRLADFWGEKYRTDEKGVTLILTNTKKGSHFIASINENLKLDECGFTDLTNSQSTRFLQRQRNDKVTELLKSSDDLVTIFSRTLKPTKFTQLKRLVKRGVRKIVKTVNS